MRATNNPRVGMPTTYDTTQLWQGLLTLPLRPTGGLSMEES